MHKFFLCLTMSVVAVAFASQAEASPKSSGHGHGHGPSGHVHAPIHHGPSHVSHSHYKNYHVTHGTRFHHGYYYRGRNHSHWRCWRWDARYGCICYWDPSVCVWYYWCQPDSCYYPVSYCPYRTYCWTTPGVVQTQPPIAVPPSPGPTDDVPPIPAPMMQR
jgi:hypothetical protein